VPGCALRIDALKTDGRALIFLTILLVKLPASAATFSFFYSVKSIAALVWAGVP